MREYLNRQVGELAAELAAGLVRLRKGYVDAAEALLQIIKPDRQYPYDFVVYRITGYRGRRGEPAGEPIDGGALCKDLRRLILDVCDSFTLRSEDYGEAVFDVESLARRYNVSTKTVQRWRKQGLVARRLVFPGGKRRIAFLESSVKAFTARRSGQIERSKRFSQLSASQKRDIIRRARRMAGFTQCTLSEIARRLAGRTGRAMETIRYTIRKHDLEHPDEAVFPHLSAPLDEQERMVVYRCFLRGVPVGALAQRYRRTRGSIYRVVNEMRARQLMRRSIAYIYSPEFELPDADEVILAVPQEDISPAYDAAEEDRTASTHGKPVHAPTGLPPYLKALYDVPLLDADTEREMFRRYNYLKYKADKARKTIDLNRVRASQLRRIEKLLIRANGVKNRIIRANLRLVVSIAKKHMGGAQTLFELISDGNVSLMRAVEKFDYSRGFRFSTYASWAIIRNFARSVPKERFQLDRFSTGNDEVLDIAASLRSYDPNETNLPELRESIEAMLAQLSPRERTVLTDHYGLTEEGEPLTLGQVGKELGLSKERVRQIEIEALEKLRKILRPQRADFLG